MNNLGEAATLANIAAGASTWKDVSQLQETAQESIKHPSQHSAYQSKFQRYRRLCDMLYGAKRSMIEVSHPPYAST